MYLQHRTSSPPPARLVLGTWRTKHPTPRAEASAFDAALDRFTHQDHAGAFDALPRLADGGHVPATGIALLMAPHGAHLYGHRGAASAGSKWRWQALADMPSEAA